ncbi:hypothetical protein K438DRAFT_1975886 [Mycena galopus ATCC 62051]|nr:hypothetical protein K438DRAFT_1975886 [Mycena galopus ATCC 62051]
MHNAPAFPPEIEREVFEIAALMHPGTIPALLRVARRVRIWIEPLLYRVIYIKAESEPMTLALIEAMNSKPPEFFRNAVRHLILATAPDDNFQIDGTRLLRLCQDIITFIASDSFLDAALLPILAEMRIQRLSLRLGVLFRPEPINFAHALFQHVTHLDFLDTYRVEEVLPDVRLVPVLTHLCVDTSVPWDSILRVLEECPGLQLLLVQWYHQDQSYASAKTPHAYDIRFVIGTYSNFWEDCESGVRGGPDLWTEADDFVARKRTGEIEATRYWLH